MSTVALFIFPAFMAYAASSDLLTMRISNRLVLGLVVAFVVLALVVNMPLQLVGLHIAAALLVLAVTFGFFAAGWMGGGDAKLAAATALWLGFGPLLPYLLYAALFGGALTLAILMVRRTALPEPLLQVGWIGRLHHADTGIPYGIALAAAGLLAYSETTIFQHFIR